MTTAVGNSFIRPDAEPKVRGEAVYGVDFEIGGTLHAALVRSNVASGRIRSIDSDAASAMPGVRLVATAADAPKILSGLALNDQPLFASEVVRFEGEPIAAVVADTLVQARAAAAAVVVDIDPLPVVATVDDGVADGAPLVHEDWASYQVAPGHPDWPRYGNVCSEVVVDEAGVDEAFAAADVIVEDEFRADRQYQAYLEPKSATGMWESGRYTVHASHQYHWSIRNRTSAALGVKPSDVRVIGHYMGGGFGAKLDVGLEPYAALLARLTGFPVKMINERSEDMITCNSRDGGVIRVRSGLSKDGKIVAREYLVDMDAGAYAGDTVYLTSIPVYVADGPYATGPTRVRARAVYTNTTPTGAFRGVSGTYLYFALERHTDNLANAVGMDRRAFRLRNVLEDGHEMLNGQVLDDSGLLKEVFEAVDELAPWETLGKGPNQGVGIAATVWLTNPLPGSATLRLEPDGTLIVVTGAAEIGTGAVVLGVRQIAAQELGMDPANVTTTMPDTDVQGFDGGAQGSRTTHIVGRAVTEAAVGMRERVFQQAAKLLGAAPDELELRDDGVGVSGDPGRRVTLGEVAGAAMFDGGPITSSGSYGTPAIKYDPDRATGLLFSTFPTPTYHVHVAEVEVDPDTGGVTVLRYLVAQEVGKTISPAGLMGQIQGGVAQGLGYALWETIQIGDDGKYRQRTLESYRLPIALDVPRVEVVVLEHPVDTGPYGAKGAAEPPIVPVAAVIGNAIADATGGPITRIPITPEDVLDALKHEKGTR
ncbi:xanthine dehydrogenase family protein molybdopterin-binding subunit [bacterium]|nr:xanthine dehydrogenase family protein molybdopterin-binding subunit [bacterium]